MTLSQKQQQLVADLTAIGNDQERFAWLVQLARSRPPLAADFKTDAYRVPGCVAKLWLVSEFREGRCFYRCDSDSQVVRAVAGLLCDLYSGQVPREILALDPSFLGQLGITQHLTANRRNALSRVWQVIREFARSHIDADVEKA